MELVVHFVILPGEIMPDAVVATVHWAADRDQLPVFAVRGLGS